ncbi:hypothetical protein SHIRM173S_12881 [Streptomyces hirsutus]
MKGGSVGRTHDKLGYVRATVPTARADAAIAAAAELSTVTASTCATRIRSTTRPRPRTPPPRPPAARTRAPPPTRAPTGGRREEPVQPVLRDGRRRLREGQPEGGRPRRHHRHPRLGRGPRPPGAAEDHHRRTQDRRLGDGHRPARRRRRDLAPDDRIGGRARLHPRRKDLDGALGLVRISTFKESYTLGGDAGGDANFDGDTTDAWGMLYDAAAGTVRVDLNDNQGFSDDTPMKPYKDGFQIGYFGTDDPSTEVAERQPFRRGDPQGRGPQRGRRQGRLRQHRCHRGLARLARRRHHRRRPRPVRRGR